MIFTCEFPYILHCSYLVLAKHFEIPLLKRLLDLNCIIAHFCKWEKYKVLLWQKEHFEISDLLKIVVCATSKWILAMKSVGKISVCIIIPSGWVLNRSALPVKAVSWWLRWTGGPLPPRVASSSLTLRKVLLLLKIRIKLVQTWAFIMRPPLLESSAHFPNDREFNGLMELLQDRTVSLEEQCSSKRDSVSLFVLPPLSVFCLLCLKSASLNKSYSSKGELLSLFIVGSHWLVVGSCQLVSDPGNVFCHMEQFQNCLSAVTLSGSLCEKDFRQAINFKFS